MVFHILHPEVRVAGRILRAHPLAAIAEVREEARDKFSRLLKHIYEVGGGRRQVGARAGHHSMQPL